MSTTAKLFKHGGSQAVRLPKAFRFEGTEVEIEKRGTEVVLRPKSNRTFKTWKALMDHLEREFPDLADFPDVPRPKEQQKRDLTW
ncbi:MAG: AbrB/MazE/SpoVT family DNA-binding domain-containing protein [Chthoniobacteraceae bacterium]